MDASIRVFDHFVHNTKLSFGFVKKMYEKEKLVWTNEKGLLDIFRTMLSIIAHSQLLIKNIKQKRPL